MNFNSQYSPGIYSVKINILEDTRKIEIITCSRSYIGWLLLGKPDSVNYFFKILDASTDLDTLEKQIYIHIENRAIQKDLKYRNLNQPGLFFSEIDGEKPLVDVIKEFLISNKIRFEFVNST